MKRQFSVLAIALSIAFVSCEKNPSGSGSKTDPTICPPETVPMDTVLYAVGQELVPDKDYYYATVWKDGRKFFLSDGSADGFCNAVCADGEDVYVVGCEAIGEIVDDGYYEPYAQNVAVLWHFKVGEEQNAERVLLGDGKSATSAVAVSTYAGDVYAAGFESPSYDRRAVYWKNGKMEYLSDGSTDALAYCVLATENGCYVGGYEQSSDNKQCGIAKIWKDGVATDLTDGSSSLAKVNALFIDDGVLYAAGAEKTPGAKWKGVLWKDGKAHYFTDEAGTEVTGLYVKNGKWLVEGNMTNADGDIVACIWTEDGVQILSEGLSLCQGSALAVAGDDVYVAGNETVLDYTTYEDKYYAHLWKNGEMQKFEFSVPDNVSIWGLACSFCPSRQ